MRIVIVEDEAVIREGIANMINRNTSHTVVGKCQSGEEGMELILHMQPDCVITDIRMPGMSGLEMLARLREKDAMPHSIIISGYSEFEYAREGIRLGIEDYLLKPISVEGLKNALKKIEEQILEQHGAFGSQSENYIRACFFGSDEEQKEAKEKLFRILPKDEEKYGIFVCYFGNIKKEMDKLEYRLRYLKRQYPDYMYLDAAEERLKLRILIVKTEEDSIRTFAEDFNQKMIKDSMMNQYEIPWAMEICSGIEEWRDTFILIQKAISHCISEGCGQLLYAKEICQKAEKEFVYPLHLEKMLLSTLGAGNGELTHKRIEEFLDNVIKKEYDAGDIRRGVLKLMGQMLDTAKEINQNAYEILRTKNCMQGVLMAYTRTEIEEILHQMGEVICEKEKRERISNYTINRTVEYIRMHYQEGISLEQVAEALNITPEYLSMLFKREMGMNFSVFLKEFRISHAKRLLKSTDMKVYEVAEACGYNNSNYFTKVFKEVTGISPADYR